MVRDLQQIKFVNQPGHTKVIRGNFTTCGSTSVVYLLTCTACQAAFVGKTAVHPARTNGWAPVSDYYYYSKNEDTPVAEHFKEDHPVRVLVLTSTTEEVIQHHLVECAWTLRCLSGKVTPWKLINKDAGIDVELLD